MREATARKFFFASVVCLITAMAFGYGLAVESRQIWPYTLVSSAREAVKNYLKFGTLAPSGRVVEAPAGAARDRFKVHDIGRIQDGYYVLVGWDSVHSQYAAWLYDSRGRMHHRWVIDYEVLDSRGPTRGHGNPHGFWPMPDGSVVVNFDNGDMLARLDACGKPVWKKPGAYHHQMTRADDGSLWVWRGEGTPYGQFQYIANIDADTGATIREIGLVEDVIRQSGELSAIFGTRPDFSFVSFDPAEHSKYALDIFHTNDVDVLGAEVAPRFPMFEAGDLLLSIRRRNLVAVLDPDDLRLKWWSMGPWWSQHDPDFVADGTISVYDNNTGRGRSEILKMDPATHEIRNELFRGEVRFASDNMGTHQYLPNGNVLIVVPQEGRILEVTARGDYVMEFNNLSMAGAGFNEHVENAVWLPADYFSTMPSC